jgi:hypothetical protein
MGTDVAHARRKIDTIEDQRIVTLMARSKGKTARTNQADSRQMRWIYSFDVLFGPFTLPMAIVRQTGCGCRCAG